MSRPSTVSITLTPALYARALKAGMPEGERALGEWLVSRAEAAAAARADALEEAAQTCEGLVTAYCDKHGGGGDYATALADAARKIRDLITKKEAP